MIKKIGLSLLLFAVLFVGNAFADVLPDPTIPEEKCIMFESVKIGSGRIISVNKDSGEVKEEQEKECFNNEIKRIYTVLGAVSSNIEFYVLDYNIDVSNISLDNVEDKAEKIIIDRLQRPSFTFIGYKPIRHEYIYQVILNGSGLYEIQLMEENRINLGKEVEKNRVNIGNDDIFQSKNISIYEIKVFVIARLFTIIIETLILFLISKFCWKDCSFKKLKIIFTGILASTVTLPLLRFVLPIFFSNYWIYVIFGEILVTIIEVFIIKYLLKIERKMAIFASILCNLCSFLAGLFIF